MGLYTIIYIVTCTPIARQRVGKHIPAEANARNNRRSIARQRVGKYIPAEANARNNRRSTARGRSCKHSSSTIEGYNETKHWKLNMNRKQWLSLHEEITYKKIISCNDGFFD
jgi:hypothetical protein